MLVHRQEKSIFLISFSENFALANLIYSSENELPLFEREIVSRMSEVLLDELVPDLVQISDIPVYCGITRVCGAIRLD